MAPPLVSPIRRLAPETLEEIIAFAPRESHLALCRVSKLLYALCVRSMYCDITLRSPSAVIRCCRTVARNPIVASAVRRFEISYTPTALPPPLPTFYALIGRALAQTPNIHHLVLLVPDPNYVAALAHCALPRLIHFQCCLALEGRLAAFLNRHRQIGYLQLGAPAEGTFFPGSGFPAQHLLVALPKLEYLVANTSTCVAPAIQCASLRAAFITWPFVTFTLWPPAPFPPLHAAPLTQTLNVLACRRPGWNLDLLDGISRRLPHIYALSLTNLFFGAEEIRGQPTPLQAMTAYLPRFSALQRLTITCTDADGEIDLEDMDSAFDTVTAWGAACPSLVECVVPQSNELRWLRVTDNLWLPSSLSPSPLGGVSTMTRNTSIGTRWIWGRLRARRYPGWERVVEAVRVREGDYYIHDPESEGEEECNTGSGGGMEHHNSDNDSDSELGTPTDSDSDARDRGAHDINESSSSTASRSTAHPAHRHLAALPLKALAAEYASDDEDAVGVGRVWLGGAGEWVGA
ncbi:hypothetical protein C8R44DRAFT_636661 [Mycena epipterygia]|nr:hypothetical protein C8R44DRAFT_636661 [Mycena epipterygia]